MKALSLLFVAISFISIAVAQLTSAQDSHPASSLSERLQELKQELTKLREQGNDQDAKLLMDELKSMVGDEHTADVRAREHSRSRPLNSPERVTHRADGRQQRAAPDLKARRETLEAEMLKRQMERPNRRAVIFRARLEKYNLSNEDRQKIESDIEEYLQLEAKTASVRMTLPAPAKSSAQDVFDTEEDAAEQDETAHDTPKAPFDETNHETVEFFRKKAIEKRKSIEQRLKELDRKNEQDL